MVRKVELISRSKNADAASRHEIWATENSFLFNTRQLLPRSSPIIKRKNQSRMSQGEKDRFLNAIQTLISTGDYGDHVHHHADHSHRMHSFHGEIGTLRFLPWHRVYLFELEEMLQAFESEIFIPYWDWTVERTIPQWLEDFTPTVIVDGLPRVVKRRPHTDPAPPNLPPQEDVDEIMRLTIYRSFTSGLEGGIFNPDGTSLLTQTQMHNEVHGWVGGIMSNPRYSPTDVLFWLHHANCGRLWSIWQKDHPDQHPNLNGTDAIMDPWSFTKVDTRDTINFGYVYE